MKNILNDTLSSVYVPLDILHFSLSFQKDKKVITYQSISYRVTSQSSDEIAFNRWVDGKFPITFLSQEYASDFLKIRIS